MTREEADALPVRLPTDAEQAEWDRHCDTIARWNAEYREMNFWEPTKTEPTLPK